MTLVVKNITKDDYIRKEELRSRQRDLEEMQLKEVDIEKIGFILLEIQQLDKEIDRIN